MAFCHFLKLTRVIYNEKQHVGCQQKRKYDKKQSRNTVSFVTCQRTGNSAECDLEACKSEIGRVQRIRDVASG